MQVNQVNNDQVKNQKLAPVINLLGKGTGSILINIFVNHILGGYYDSEIEEDDYKFTELSGHWNCLNEEGFLGYVGNLANRTGNVATGAVRFGVQKLGKYLPKGTWIANRAFSLFGSSNPFNAPQSLFTPLLNNANPFTLINNVNWCYIKDLDHGSISENIKQMRQTIKDAQGEEILIIIDNLLEKGLSKLNKEMIRNLEDFYKKEKSVDSFIKGVGEGSQNSVLATIKSFVKVTAYAFVHQFFIEGQEISRKQNEGYTYFKKIVLEFSNKVSNGIYKNDFLELFENFEENGEQDVILEKIQTKYQELVQDYVSLHGGWDSKDVKETIFKPYLNEPTMLGIRQSVATESTPILPFAKYAIAFEETSKIVGDEERKKQLQELFVLMSEKLIDRSFSFHCEYEHAIANILFKILNIFDELVKYEQENVHPSGTSAQHTQSKETKEKYLNAVIEIVKKAQEDLLPFKLPDWIMQFGIQQLLIGKGIEIGLGKFKGGDGLDKKLGEDVKKISEQGQQAFAKYWEYRSFDGLVEVNRLLDEWKVKKSVYDVVNKVVAGVVDLLFATSAVDLIDLVISIAEEKLGVFLASGNREDVPFKLTLDEETRLKSLETIKGKQEELKISNVEILNAPSGKFTDLFTFERDGKSYKAWIETKEFNRISKMQQKSDKTLKLCVCEIKPFKLHLTAEALKRLLKGEGGQEKMDEVKGIISKLLTVLALAQAGKDWGKNVPVSPKEIFKAIAPFLGGWGKLIDEGKSAHANLKEKTGSLKLTNKIKGVFEHAVTFGKDIFKEEIDEFIDKGLDKINGVEKEEVKVEKKEEVKKEEVKVEEKKKIIDPIKNVNNKVLIGNVIDKAVGTATGLVDNTLGFFMNRILDIAPQLGSKLTIKGQERMGDPKFMKKASAEVMKDINEVLDLHANNPNADDLKPLIQKEFIKKAIEALLRPLYPNGVIDMPYPDELKGNIKEIKNHQEKAWDHIVRQAEVHVNWLIHSKGALKLNRYEFIGKDHIEGIFKEKLGCVENSTIANSLKNKIRTKLFSWTKVLEPIGQKIASVWKTIQEKKDNFFDFKCGKQFNWFLDTVFGFIFFTIPKYTVVLGTDVFVRTSIDHFAENVDSIATSGLPEKVLQVAVLSTLRQLSSFENREYRFKNISDAEADRMYKTERRKLESNVINTVLKGTPFNIVVKVAVRIVDIVAAVLISIVAFSPFVRRRLINLASYFNQDKEKIEELEKKEKIEEPKEKKEKIEEPKEKKDEPKVEVKKPSSLYDIAVVPVVHFFRWIKGEEIVAPQRKNIAIKGVETLFRAKGDTAMEWTMDLIDRALPLGAEELKKIRKEEKIKKTQESAKLIVQRYSEIIKKEIPNENNQHKEVEAIFDCTRGDKALDMLCALWGFNKATANVQMLEQRYQEFAEKVKKIKKVENQQQIEPLKLLLNTELKNLDDYLLKQRAEKYKEKILPKLIEFLKKEDTN